MRFKTRVMLAVGCVCLLGLSVPALSLPKPKGLAQHQQRAQAPVKKNKISRRVMKVHADARRMREVRAMRLISTPISETPKQPMLGWPALVSEARKYIGTNPTARSRLWCATFMNMVLAKVGYSGTNSDAAKSFAQYGSRISEPQVGAIAVLTRGSTGGHVGVVSGIDSQGNPIIISGNHGHRVGEATYPRSRVIAYVMPSGDRSPPTTTEVAARSYASERRAPSQSGIDSPITELIAAIEAEQKRSERPAHGSAQPQRSAQHPMPEPRPIRRAGTLPLDPALARLLGITAPTRARAQAPSAAPQATPPQRQREVQQPGRIASAASAGVSGFR